MPKSMIRPPRRPAKEDPAITIANQARQIDNLVERIHAVAGERDAAQKAHRMAIDEIAMHKDAGEALCNDISALKRTIEEMQAAYTRLQGWQDCAREMLGNSADVIHFGST